MLHKKANSIEIFSDPTFSTAILRQTVPSLMLLLDSVHEQATQILRNHAEIPMIMCNIYNPIPASVLDISITSFEVAYMKMKEEF